MNDINVYRFTLVLLVVIFSLYNVVVYHTVDEKESYISLNESALRGAKLYQKNNCTACHQLYGLGGYLGPDLTNSASVKNKGPQYMKVMINSGIKSMPKFNFTLQELDDITSFLVHVDSTGFYPNHLAETKFSGWVELKYKKK